MSRARAALGIPALVAGATAIMLAGAAPLASHAQQAPPTTRPAALVFDGATVVDVEHGQLVPDQRVVIAGNRIQAMGKASAVPLPRGARIVDARGKYLIPGLWDMHVHPWRQEPTFYPRFIAHGVTGVRDMSMEWPIDSLQQWRREIGAGTRIGPRLLGTGKYLGPTIPLASGLFKQALPGGGGGPKNIPVHTPDQGRRIVDSLRAAGADFVKVRSGVPDSVYFVIAREARRVGLPLVGHVPGAPLYGSGGLLPMASTVTAFQASDSGQRSLEHLYGLPHECLREPATGCAAIAAALIRNGTWLTPTMLEMPADPILLEVLRVVGQAGVPLLAGTDVSADSDRKGRTPGASLHAELATMVRAGLSPLTALQSATRNPAQFLEATDSLGTVAPGKLADLVLLDGNPLEDITNTTMIRAVVANGRYFDRLALDRLLVEAGRRP